MTEKWQNILNITAVILLVAAGGYLFFRGTASTSGTPAATVATSSPSAGATTTDIETSGGTLGITGTGGYTITEIPVEATPKLQAPDYNAALAFSPSSTLTAEQKTALEGQVEAIRAQLKQNPSSYDAWFALGGTFLSAGDYAGAEKVWTYVALKWPSDAAVQGNLGDLYLTYLKDYPKAEASYLAAIRNDPHQTNAYRNLVTMYTNMYKTDTSAAADILKQGIQNNPDALDLYVALAHYYRDHGRIPEAKTSYEVAIAQAKRLADAANFGAVADLEAELAALQ